ncbi:MAG: hypothetical protein M1836_005008 [Candelina mexicana]|nr:MAG: hypothetical protein M1836_005008 [Candelina mexicana]
MARKANQTKSSTDPRTPWNRHLMLYLFAIEAIISFLMLPFGIASAALEMAMSLYACAVSIVGLINSLTHIFVIRTGRPVVLGAIVGVNTLWMLMWVALIANQTVFTVLYDYIMEHEICDNEGGWDHKFDTECTGKRLGYVCVPFAVLGSINSIVILSLSICALQREKRGIVAAPPDEFPNQQATKNPPSTNNAKKFLNQRLNTCLQNRATIVPSRSQGSSKDMKGGRRSKSERIVTDWYAGFMRRMLGWAGVRLHESSRYVSIDDEEAVEMPTKQKVGKKEKKK